MHPKTEVNVVALHPLTQKAACGDVVTTWEHEVFALKPSVRMRGACNLSLTDMNVLRWLIDTIPRWDLEEKTLNLA